MRQAKYRRLKLAEREEISRELAVGMSLRDIGTILGRSPSTISREVNRIGMDRYTYRAIRSEKRATRNAGRRRGGKRKLNLNEFLCRYVRERLLQRWSPQQIAKRIEKEYPEDKDMRISHEAIYAYVYVLPKGELKRELLKALRQGRKRRRKRNRAGESAVRRIESMIGIEKRPKEVLGRKTPGHWEGDILVGRNRQSVLGSLVERKTRFTILVPLKNKKAEEIRKSFGREIKTYPASLMRTLTYDQGREMAEHKLFTKSTKMRVYFAHLGSPWERGTNENTNGLIRQYFPKGTDFNRISRREIKWAQDELNGRPRKCLDFMTPGEAFQQVLR